VQSLVGSSADETTIHNVGRADALIRDDLIRIANIRIAKRSCGNANAWKTIFDADHDQLSNPDRIKTGQGQDRSKAEDSRRALKYRPVPKAGDAL